MRDCRAVSGDLWTSWKRTMLYWRQKAAVSESSSVGEGCDDGESMQVLGGRHLDTPPERNSRNKTNNHPRTHKCNI